MPLFELRDKALATEVFDKLDALDLDIQLMHVCGTHQDTLVRYGLDERLREVGVRVRQGPGCPVCVTTPREIEEAIAIARAGAIVCSYGDMIRVPGKSGSLGKLRSAGVGADIRVVFSAHDAVKIARATDREVVFVAVGFETTTPATAAVIGGEHAEPPPNFSILCCHRVIPPALRTLIEAGEVRINGLIEPGHVSVIIGTEPYRFITDEYAMPQVIAGFEPLDFLMGVYALARQIVDGAPKLENMYPRAVKREGNPVAKQLIDDVFAPCDVAWRGFPMLPGSGLALRTEYQRYDARERFAQALAPLDEQSFAENPGCRCGETLRGVIEGDECPLFAKVCTPQNPVGPCMVSREGSCNILYRYRDRK